MQKYIYLAILLIVGCTGPKYSDGIRGGHLQKFSSKGVFWKTYEGELALSGLKTIKIVDDSRISNTFEFSVEDEGVAKELFELLRNGEDQYVTVEYIQTWWSGWCDTNYRVVRIIRNMKHD